MGRHRVTNEMIEGVKSDIEKGYPKARIKLKYSLGENVYRRIVGILGVKPEKQAWGMSKVYGRLQGR